MIGRILAALGLLATLGAGPVDGALTLAELRAKYLTPADHIVDIGGVEVRYRDEGHGPAVLLLHGSNSTLDTWDGVAARLVPHYRVIRFDQPPQGLSGPVSDAAKVTLPSADALLTGLLDRLKTGPVIAVGVSSGGTMAYYLAGAHPERVRALVLSNAPSDPLDLKGLVNPPDLVAAEARAKATGRRDPDWWWAYFRSLYGDPARITAAQIARNYDFGRRVAEPNLLHLFALAGNNDLTHDRLAHVTAPTLIVWGMRDHVLPYPAAVALAGHLTAIHPSVVLLDDVGHYPPIEVPERFAAIVDTFVQQVVTAP
jgi:pimeloyl-ACP methyl ester carboxylesterase